MKAVILCSAVLLAVPAARAADLTPETINAARMVAVTTCANCHGHRGNSISPKFPKLGGQVESYLTAQMQAFKSHERGDSDAVAYMWGMSAPLEDDLIAGLAAYYAAQPPAPGERVDPAASARGRVIYEQGLADSSIPACGACHGPAGTGQSIFPRVAGQSSQYLLKQLHAFRSKLRNVPVMNVVTASLSESDLRDVSAYMAGLGH
jgi:cytochrome c553